MTLICKWQSSLRKGQERYPFFGAGLGAAKKDLADGPAPLLSGDAPKKIDTSKFKLSFYVNR
jgi:hypothetical protein